MVESGKIEIKLGGSERTIKFGLGATKVVCDYHRLNLSQLAERFGLDDLFTEEIYGGLVHALALQNKSADFNRAQVMDWIDEMPQEDMQKVFDCWLLVNQHGETRYEKFLKVLQANNPESQEKKKLTGSKSTK